MKDENEENQVNNGNQINEVNGESKQDNIQPNQLKMEE